MNAPVATPVSPQLVGMDIIRTLIGFDTTSRDSNMALIDWVRDYLAGHGIDSQLTTNDDGRKANLFATLPARNGNVTTDGIVLSGHTDVVPVDGQPWESDPFVATLKGDKLYGRGVADMKSFSAIGLAFYRGLTLSVPRIILLLGLTDMALAHARNIEIFAFIVPLVLAKPLSEQLGTLLTGMAPAREGQPRSHLVILAALAITVAGWTSTKAPGSRRTSFSALPVRVSVCQWV